MDITDQLQDARDHFIEATSRIAHFWGFPKALGAIYGAIYLSPEPLSLDDLVARVNVTKGAVSTHVRALDRLQMIHKQVKLGDRKDYYIAETDLWAVVRRILRQRRQSEFEHALGAVGASLAKVRQSGAGLGRSDLETFYAARMEALQSFFKTLDGVVAAVLKLDDLRLGTVQRLLRGAKSVRRRK